MRLLALILLMAGLNLSAARAEEGGLPPVTYPKLVADAAEAQGFVPSGWKLETEAKGDLDRDGRDDLALVMRQTDPRNVIKPYPDMDTTVDSNPRILAVALAQEDGGYRLVLENHRLIPRLDNPSQDDPLSEGGVTVERGNLIVALYLFMSAGGWDAGHTTFRFRYEDSSFRLIGHDNYNVNRGSGEVTDVSINLLTGKVVIKTGNIESDAETTTVKRLKKKPVVKIDELGPWGEGFEPEY